MLKGFYKIEREGWGGERGGREGVGGRRRERQGNTGSNQELLVEQGYLHE